MALLKQALEVMKKKIISHYGKSFRTSSNAVSYMKYEEDSTKETHFGFQTVKESEKAEKVHSLFEMVASKYDVMNDAMSFGFHNIWKDIFIQRLGPTADTHLLDVAGGTGDIAFRFLKYLNAAGHLNACVTLCDINKAMLDVGQLRARKLGFNCEQISWLHGDAEKLPVNDASFTAYTIAFGIRNVTHIDAVLDEAYRVLKPGGRFMCMEFSQLNNKMLQWFADSLQAGSGRNQFRPDPARKLYDVYHCCVYSEKLLMMDRGTVQNM